MSPKKHQNRRRFRIDIDTKDARIIHICYNGQETTRITDAILEEKPVKVYYLHHIADIYLEYREKNLELIRKTIPLSEIEEREVDYASYFSITGELTKIFEQEFKIPKTVIIINLGTGSKMVACANMDMYRIYPDNIGLIYPYSKDYHPERIGSSHEGAMHAARPPEFKYKIPSPEVIRGLQVLYSLCRAPRFGEKHWFTYVGDWETRWKRAVDQYITEHMKKCDTHQEYEIESNRVKDHHNSQRILRLLESEWDLIRQEDRQKISITIKGKNMMGVFRNFDYGLNLDKLEREFISSEDQKSRIQQEILDFDGPIGKFIDDDGLIYKRKVQIIFNVKEHDRITAPILQDKPDCIYYFSFKSSSVPDLYSDYKTQNIETIRKGLPKDHQCEIIEDIVDYVDYYAIIGKMAGIFSKELKKEPKTRIAINLGTGSKMCAIAVMDAYRFWPQNIVPFYLFSRDYNTKRDAPFHIGDMFRAEVPKFKLKAPEPELIQMMQVLGKSIENPKEETKTQYAYQINWQNNMLKSGILHEPKTPKEKVRGRQSAIKNIMKSDREKLKKWDYITETKEGNQVRINLTDLGKKMLKIFQNYDY